MTSLSNRTENPKVSRRILVPSGRKPRVLFVHPQGFNYVPGQADITRFANIMAPMGIAWMSAYLERAGYETRVLDGYAIPRSVPEMAEAALALEPDIVAFSVTTSGFPEAYDVASALNQARPDLPTVFGGVHVSSMRTELMQRYPLIDYAIVGEGEQAILALLEQGMDAPESVPSLLYRAGGDIRVSSVTVPPIALDELPFPAYERLPGFPKAYHLAIFNYGKAPATSTVTSRGCPYTCSYCDRSVYGKSFRFNSAEYVYEHMRYLRERFGTRHVTFYDDLFTYDRERIEALCTKLIDHPLGMTFACDVRVNHIDQELVRMMKAAGCWQMAFGIESGDPVILRTHRRDPKLTRIHEVATMIRRERIKVKGLFIMGLPGEDEAAIRKSIDFAVSLPLDEINLAKFTPFPGAPLFGSVREHGEFNEDWRLMNCFNFVFVPRGLTRERLEELYSEFIITFYHRYRVLWGYFTMLWRSPHSVLTLLRHIPYFAYFALSMWFRASRAKRTAKRGTSP
jgi:anaerobic magnesium-protoporphyrin IX monomethyl ester cyclase